MNQQFVFRLKLSNESGDDYDIDSSDGVVVAPSKPKLKKPSMYKVLLLNDDYTPMEFVVHILENFFLMSREQATQIMLAVHTTGSGVAGVYPQDVAETKSEQVNEYARDNQHPLMSKIEMTD
ncbi:MAG: ATP-dependent Clp protease adapter ClpS [Pseudomonadales bacterium]|nr:ATP-dependent Clp protease adapter ClpS [Pseudomonadales bacterium]